jgi:hypothetical protein
MNCIQKDQHRGEEMLSWEKREKQRNLISLRVLISLHTCDARENHQDNNNIENSMNKNDCRYNL